ncbi:slit homolog 3 protein-like [Strongylocentrotus purpuratus]|uniref:TIR domain-containing protein n=1 Tax=Strongylocentrotus purpuratus TaxID=7668 RepID=A0A7M7PDX2_STRPU|nr:slit homolog 3 protein-like [Strongylocentrotus purpuratus]
MHFKHHSSLFPSLVMAFLLPLMLQAFQGDSMGTISSGLHTGSVRQGCYQDLEQRKIYCINRGLDSVPQNLAEDTKKLDLSYNNITVLQNSSFERYPLITFLDITANDIRVIEPTLFHPLKKLVELHIRANPRLVLPPTGLFRWAGKLTSLDLSASNLKSLPNDTLKWNQHIDYLNLGFNYFTLINISTCGSVGHASFDANNIEQLTKETFTFACQTDSLDLSANPIKLIDPIAIAALHTHSLKLGYAGGHSWTPEMLRNVTIGIARSQIKRLIVSAVNLSFFPRDVFTPLRDYSFHLLDFSNNKVNALYPFVFSNLTLLDQLVLSHNKIATIEPNFFDGMQALKVLNMNGNQVRRINTGNHAWTINLIELYLSWNLMTGISQFAFLGLQNLTILDLSYNKRLTSIYLTSYTGLNNIHTVDLSGCSITYLQFYTPVLKSLRMERNNNNFFSGNPLHPGKSFKNSINLVHLDLQESDVSSSNLWDRATNVSLFEGLFNLTTLDMSKNLRIGILGLELGIFHNLSALQELSLDACAISNLHPLVFTGLESLQKLNLSGNNLNQIRTGVLTGLGQIRSITLDENILANLDEGTFLNNSRLTSLSLANNKLTSLNENTFRPIYSSLSLVDLSQNPLVCTCDLEWLLDWLNQNRTVSLANEEQTLCAAASLAPLREKPLLHFNPTELCRFNYATFSLIPIVIVSLVVFLVLVYYKRWKLKYKLFLLKLAVIGYRERLDARNHNDYEFDVNIISYDDDEEWIRENLRPTLEDQLPQFQRNVFGDAGLIPGMYYLEAVDYVVSRSYKTIILLSRAAVRDRWFMLKFRTAMDHVSDTQTEFVVVVFLEDIPDDEIPFLARLFLSDGRPYLYWTEDVRGQEYFWKELAKNLTINLRTNDLIPNE